MYYIYESCQSSVCRWEDEVSSEAESRRSNLLTPSKAVFEGNRREGLGLRIVIFFRITSMLVL